MKINITNIFDKEIIKQYLKYVFIFLFIINLIIGYSFIQMGKQYTTNGANMIERTITEYGDVDLSHICKISDCNKIYSGLSMFNDRVFAMNNKGILIDIGDFKSSCCNDFLIDIEGFRLTNDLNIVYNEPIYKIVLKTNSREFIITSIKTYIMINILFLILFSIIFFTNTYKEKRKHLLNMMGTEGSLRERNMRILTENVHHELNTPIAIIQGSIKKLEIDMIKSKEINSNCTTAVQGKCKSYNNNDFDFNQLYSSIDSINTVLRRMSNFKQIKYSNGNKTINDIVRYSANSMNIYKKSNFDVEMKEELNHYNLFGDLTNGDLLNIISNHLRNSLEAKASKIIVDCIFKEDKRKQYYGKLHIFITDNGIGLRDKSTGLPLDSKKLDDVFKPYYSTKNNEGVSKITNSTSKIMNMWINIKSFFETNEENSEIRGVGLFLNKQMLLESGGDLKLRETSDKGTVFEIIVNAKESDTLITQKKLLKELL